MKKVIFIIWISICAYGSSKAQIGVAFHQSNIPFIGVNYQVSERFLPELRVSTDNFFANTTLELSLNYLIIKKEDYQFYSGIGARSQVFEGVVIPVGVNYYPFENKNFGFHVELAGLFGESNLMRGSWGIRFNLN